MINKTSSYLCIAAAIGLVAGAQAATPTKTAGYAETVYAEYAASANGKLNLELSLVGGGPLQTLANKPFSSVIGWPSYVITASDNGLNTYGHVRKEADLSVIGKGDMELTSADFTRVGLPAAQGKYRVFDVAVTLGDKVSHHTSMEFCWSAQGHCVVLDPSIEFLDSVVSNRLRLRADGAGPRIMTEPSRRTSLVGATLATCGLASNHSVRGRSSTWPQRTVTYKNLLGMTVVQKTLGAQQAGISCDASCKPQPYGYSNASSAWANVGFTAACDNDFGYGTSGSSGKWIAESKCTHKALGSASASASVSGQGSISVAIAWDLGGSVDSTGGQTMDSCALF